MISPWYIRLALVICFLFNFPSIIASHSPSKVTFQYDFVQKKLHIEMHHVTRKTRKHYIRRLSVYKNDQEVQVFAYNHQATTSIFTQDVDVEAMVGDRFRVQAICMEAGRIDETWTVE